VCYVAQSSPITSPTDLFTRECSRRCRRGIILELCADCATARSAHEVPSGGRLSRHCRRRHCPSEGRG
jgi:hypothetical protein